MKPRNGKNTKLTLIMSVIVLLVTLVFCEDVFLSMLGAADETFNRLIGQEDPIVRNPHTAEIHILDVGQADAIVITCGDRAMLVDAGEWNTADYVSTYIKNLGIKRFDTVVATHPHSDHIGGMGEILKKYGADRLIMPYVIHETSQYEDLLDTIADLKIPVTEPQPGTELPFGDASLLMLSPSPETEWEEVNNESVMFLLEYNGVRMLFTGDAEVEAEKTVLDAGYPINCDLMKVAHHGSKTSSSEAFLDAVSPQSVFVTCEPDSKDNLPAESILKRYEERGCRVYRTDTCGAIVITIDETGTIKINCASDQT